MLKGCFLCPDLWGNGNWVAAEWHEAICFATSTWFVCSSEWSLEMKPHWHLFYTKAFEENVEGDFGEKWMEPIQWPTFPRHPGAQGLIEQLITLIQSGLGKPGGATATCKICSRQTPCRRPCLLKYDPILGSPTFSSSLLEIHSPIISGACSPLRTRRCMNKPQYSTPPLINVETQTWSANRSRS